MKTLKRFLPPLMAVMVMLTFTMCEEDNDLLPIQAGAPSDITPDDPSDPPPPPPPGEDGSTSDIYYGQDNYAGTLTITNDDTNLYVTYTITAGDLTLDEVHVWAGTDLAGVPVAGDGAPIPGLFPYAAEDLDAATFTVTIPISSLGFTEGDSYCGATVYVLAHATLSNGETAWAFGTPFSEWNGTARWGWYVTYTITCDSGGPTPDMTSETAFAKGGWVFASSNKANPEGLPSLNLTNNRWGWAINIAADGTYRYDIYAGAALNDITKGVKVGLLTVTVSGGTATVTYAMLPGFFMSEAHVYAGDARPTTIAPGQYGHTANFDPLVTTFTLPASLADTDGDGIWIIAHAVVFGNFGDPGDDHGGHGCGHHCGHHGGHDCGDGCGHHGGHDCGDGCGHHGRHHCGCDGEQHGGHSRDYHCSHGAGHRGKHDCACR